MSRYDYDYEGATAELDACKSPEVSMEVSNLLVTLALTLVLAALGAAIAVRLKQSVILGYIVAGLIISPYTPGFVGDLGSVEALADLGIILLMFTIGVELSIRELARVGRVAIAGGVIQTIAMIAVGAGAGLLLGWSTNASLFFGAAIAISSSTVLSKVLGERGALGSIHGRISLGWAAVQDLSLIVIVVVLSSLTSGGSNLLHDVVLGGGKALLFLIVLVPIGSRLLPFVLLRISALRSREIFILAVAGIALGTAYLASLFGMSTALGALVAGIVVSESDLSHQILGAVMPLRDVFAGLFFVSIGMLVNPSYVAHNIPLIIFVVVLIIVVKGVISTGLVTGLGRPLNVAVLAGVALAQAGEFSFLLGRMGVDLNALNEGEFSLILASTAVTIILAPAAYQLAIPLVGQMEHRRRQTASMDDQLASLAAQPLQGHAVICGYGRVGRLIGGALRRRGLPLVVIEQDAEVAHRLRQEGLRVVLGDADNFTVLQHVGLGQARLLVVAIPGALETRQTVGNARQINSSLPVIARVQSEGERDYMQRQDVTAVVGERELGLEMTRLTLRRYGVSAMEALAVVQRLRD